MASKPFWHLSKYCFFRCSCCLTLAPIVNELRGGEGRHCCHRFLLCTVSNPPNPSPMPTPSIPSSSTTASCCFGYEGDNRMRNMGEEVKKGTMSDMKIWNWKKSRRVFKNWNKFCIDGWMCCVDVGLAVEDTWHGTTSSPIRWWWPWIITITKQPSGPHSALLTLWHTMSHYSKNRHFVPKVANHINKYAPKHFL